MEVGVQGHPKRQCEFQTSLEIQGSKIHISVLANRITITLRTALWEGEVDFALEIILVFMGKVFQMLKSLDG